MKHGIKIIAGILLLSVFSLFSGEIKEQETVRLFVIERSKNANIVCYDGVLDDKGDIDEENPVRAYWLLLAKDGRRQELTWLDKKAYGFKVKPEKEKKSFLMTLTPFRERAVKVYKSSATVLAEMRINSLPAVIEKIYIKSKESISGPKVIYIELFGKEIESGKPAYEKITP